MNSIAQSNPASPSDPSVAKLKDPHLNEVVEDLTSPTLEKTHLIPDRPLIGFVDEKSGYSVSEIRLQWRLGDPIDLLLMRPINVKNPPVILYIYGYPSDTDIFKDRDWQELVTRGGLRRGRICDFAHRASLS